MRIHVRGGDEGERAGGHQARLVLVGEELDLAKPVHAVETQSDLLRVAAKPAAVRWIVGVSQASWPGAKGERVFPPRALPAPRVSGTRREFSCRTIRILRDGTRLSGLREEILNSFAFETHL